MKRLVALLLILCTFSCTDVEKSPVPKNLYSKDKMAEVLTDLYIIEGAIVSNKTAYLKTGIMPSSYIYNKYETDSVSFKENLDFYTDRIEDYLVILDKVQTNLKILQDSVSTRQELMNKKQQKSFPKNQSNDSIKVHKKDGAKKKAL